MWLTADLVKCMVARFVLYGPLVVLGVDWIILLAYGTDPTITGVIRSWAAVSRWPEILYVTGCVVLYLHLFRGVL